MLIYPNLIALFKASKLHLCTLNVALKCTMASFYTLIFSENGPRKTGRKVSVRRMIKYMEEEEMHLAVRVAFN